MLKICDESNCKLLKYFSLAKVNYEKPPSNWKRSNIVRIRKKGQKLQYSYFHN